MQTSNDKFLRLNQVKEKTGLCRASIYNYVKYGAFPKQIKLGPRSVAWLESEINAWMEKCRDGSRSEIKKGG